MDECRVVAINNLISYISPTENPLSANVVMIQGKDALWLYDVGNHPDIPAIIDTYSNGRKVNAILSHFHEDHTGNLPCMSVDEVYQGKYTHRHTGMGIVVEDDIYI
jgi:glyoxylase-like metal-dependent hydrolase (beta-lactamase superfamily II)